MGFPRTTVYAWITAALAAITYEAYEDAHAVLKLELARLDDYQAAIHAEAADGDKSAIETCLRIIERRARLLGLGPKPQDFSIAATTPSANGHAPGPMLTVSFVSPKANGYGEC